MSDPATTASHQPQADKSVRDLQARLYREIGVLAVSVALDLVEEPLAPFEIPPRSAGRPDLVTAATYLRERSRAA